MSLAIERSRGTLMRLLVSPITNRHLLAAKGLACLATTLVTSTALITLGITVFGVTPTSYPCWLWPFSAVRSASAAS